MKKTLLLLSMLCLAFGISFAQERPVKFYLGVTGYDGDVESKVDMTVYDGYGFTIGMPVKGSYVGTDKAKFEFLMTDVNSLGVETIRTHEVNLNTGIVSAKASLNEYLSNLYAFEGATCPVTVIDGDVRKVFTYVINGYADQKIVGVPFSEDAARAAWRVITSHVKYGQKSVDDSYVDFKSGTYVQLGNERLVFDNDVTVLDGDWSEDEIKTEVKSVTRIITGVATGADTYKAEIFLPKGSRLDLGASYAELDKDATLYFDASAAYDDSELMGAFTSLSNDITSSNKLGVLDMVKLFNQIIGLVDAANNVPIKVVFEDPFELTVYPGKNDPQQMSVSDFMELRKTVPNAVAYTTSDHEDKVEGVRNVVIEYTVGKNGKFYQCPEFVLTDLEDFYTPNDFEAVAGNYICDDNASKTYTSVCLPFAITGADVHGQIETFSHSDTQKTSIYFLRVDAVEAGMPCIVKLADKSAWNINLAGRTIVADPISSLDIKGTYIKFACGAGKYKLNSEGTLYGITKDSGKVWPFRSYIDLLGDHDISYGDASSAKLNIVEIDEEDGIESIISNNTITAVYDINGVQYSNLKKGVNIVKMINGQTIKIVK